MKYKRLTHEELLALEKEFIHFLAAAQITAKDWEQMKSTEIEKADELLDVFSDMVFERVMNKIRYLEYRDKKILNIYHCLDDKIILVGLRVKDGNDVDLTSPDIFKQWNQSSMHGISILKTEKGYIKERGLTVFELLQNGCFITNDELFKMIDKLVK